MNLSPPLEKIQQDNLERLRALLAEGEAQFERGEFIVLEDTAAIDAFFESLTAHN